jgi:hypothetical protein
MMTLEQQRVFEEAVTQGLVKNSKQAYEIGCAALRKQLQEARTRREAAESAEAQAIARNQGSLFSDQ